MMIKSLFKFVQGAAHLWDLHEIGLARKERMLQVNFGYKPDLVKVFSLGRQTKQ